MMISINKIFCSVVMPVHNGERFLREAIESVLNQTHTNFEFLIIENCSTDSSINIINSFADLRIRLIIEEDCGQVQAYNRGFKEAKGDYIFIHDQDDVSNPSRFEKQLYYVLEKNLDICGSCFNLIDESTSVIGKIETPEFHEKIIRTLFYRNSTIFNSSTCLKKSIFSQNNDFDIRFFPSSDYEFYLRGIKKFRFGNIQEYLYSWRQHKNQISSSYVKHIVNKTISISLKYSSDFPLNMKSTFIALVYYYNNKMFKALIWLFIALYTDKFSNKLVRYLIIIIFFGVPMKIVRKFNLLHSKFYTSVRNCFNKLVKVE